MIYRVCLTLYFGSVFKKKLNFFNLFLFQINIFLRNFDVLISKIILKKLKHILF